MTKLIVLIGAKRAGKTTIATNAVANLHDTCILESSADLKQETRRCWNIPWYITDDELEAHKDDATYFPFLRGRSYRDAIIYTDTVYKEQYGENIWINLTIGDIIDLSTRFKNIVLTGSGFEYEAGQLISFCKDFGIYLSCVKVVRNGCTYSNDSRKDIYHMFPWRYTIQNNDSVQDAVDSFNKIIGLYNV